MVYIDFRDRKFILIVIVPTILAAIFMVLAEAFDDPILPVVLIGGTFAVMFVVFLGVTFVMERMQG